MRKHQLLATAFGLMVLLGVSSGLSAERVWVSSFDAKLKAEGSAVSETLAVLAVGAELTVNGEDGRWLRVTATGGKTGWIYRGKVSTEPPGPSGEKSGDDSVAKLLTGLTGSRIGSGEVDTSRSMRMLSVENKEKKKSSGPDQAYEDALESVLSRRVTEVHLERFLEKGEIGEYAK